MTYTEQKEKLFPETESLYTTIREAKEKLDIQMAKLIQLTMLELADEHPKITKFSFTCDYEYDDEGGWFLTHNFQSEPELEFDEDDVYERIREHGFDEEQVALAFMSTNTREGEITVIALRGLFGDPFQHPGPPAVDPKGEPWVA